MSIYPTAHGVYQINSRPWWRNKLWILALITSCLGLIWFAISPYFAVYSLRRDISDEDTNAIRRDIDFPALRENLKEQLTAQLMSSELGGQSRPNGFEVLGTALVNGMANTMIDGILTPAGIVKLSQGSTAENSTERRHAPFLSELGNMMTKRDDGVSFSYEALDRFAVLRKVPDSRPLKLIWIRSGFATWKLSQVELPTSITANSPEARSEAKSPIPADTLSTDTSQSRPDADQHDQVWQNLQAWAHSIETSDIDQFRTFYADQLENYYGKLNVPAGEVAQLMASKIRSYTTLNLHVSNPLFKQIAPNLVQVDYDKQYEFTGPDAPPNDGETKSSLRLARMGDKWYIVAEFDRQVCWSTLMRNPSMQSPPGTCK